MRCLHSYHDQMDGVMTYELADGRRIRLDARMVREHGAAKLLYHAGLLADPATLPRRPVYWGGRQVGTVPGDFEPFSARSRSPFYDVRPGDFVAQDDGWLASRSMGPGDLAAISGFVPTSPDIAEAGRISDETLRAVFAPPPPVSSQDGEGG